MALTVPNRSRETLTAAVAAIALGVSSSAAAGDAPERQTKSVSEHQRSVLTDFKIADENRDGALSDSEFETFKARRDAQAMSATSHQEEALGLKKHGKAVSKTSRKAQDDKMAASPHQKRAVSDDDDAMAATEHQEEALQLRHHQEQVSKTSRKAMDEKMAASPHQEMALTTVDYNGDDIVTYVEAYYWETFERPSVFPTREEAIPQDKAGTWVAVGIGGHPTVKPSQRFGANAVEKAIAEGGFDAVDADGDGEVSIFEASSSSMMHWTENIYEFEAADTDGDLALSESEFERFRNKVRTQVESAQRAGLFPPQSS